MPPPRARPPASPRHRFIVTRDGYASAIRDPREDVHGVLWDCSLGDIRTLDKFEELASGLYVKINQPVIVRGRRQAGADLCRPSRPSLGAHKPGYMEAVIAGAKHFGLPESYIAGLNHF